MRKGERQAIIREIIQDQPVGTQEDLLEQLRIAGVEATQATISRDIREMQMVKAADETGKVRYTILVQKNEEEQRLQEAVQDSVLSFTTIEFVTIVKTRLGEADIVAALLDELPLAEVSGTIAGADTVVVFSASGELAESLQSKLNAYLQQGQA